MTQAELEVIARERAKAYGLDPALVCAMCEWESGGWNPWATRYEPAFYERYISPLVLQGKLKSATEATARGFSYGLMQVMGATARELGFSGKYLTQLCDPFTGIDIGCRKLKECFSRYPDEANALLKYNGGGDTSYPNHVQKLKPKYT